MHVKWRYIILGVAFVAAVDHWANLGIRYAVENAWSSEGEVIK